MTKLRAIYTASIYQWRLLFKILQGASAAVKFFWYIHEAFIELLCEPSGAWAETGASGQLETATVHYLWVIIVCVQVNDWIMCL